VPDVTIETSSEVLARLPNANVPEGAEIIVNAKVEGLTQSVVRSNKRASERGPIRRARRVPMESDSSPSSEMTSPRPVVGGKAPMLRPAASTIPPMQYGSSEEAASSASKSNSSEEEIEELVRQRLASILMLKAQTNVAECCSHSSEVSGGTNDHDMTESEVITQEVANRMDQELLADAEHVSEELVRQRLTLLMLSKARTNVAKCCSHSSVVSEASNDHDLTAITSHDAESNKLDQVLLAMAESTAEDGRLLESRSVDDPESSDVPVTSMISPSQNTPLPQQLPGQQTASDSSAHSNDPHDNAAAPGDINMLHGEQSVPAMNNPSQTAMCGNTSSQDHYHDNQACRRGARSGLYATHITESVGALAADGCACAGNANCSCLGCRDHPNNPVTMDYVMEALAFQATDEYEYNEDIQIESDGLTLDDLLEHDGYGPAQQSISTGSCCPKPPQTELSGDLKTTKRQDQPGNATTSAPEERSVHQPTVANAQQQMVTENRSLPVGNAASSETRTQQTSGQPLTFQQPVIFPCLNGNGQQSGFGQQPFSQQLNFANYGIGPQSNFIQLQQQAVLGQQPNFPQQSNPAQQPSLGQQGQQYDLRQQMIFNPHPSYSQLLDPVSQRAPQQQLIPENIAFFGHMMLPIQPIYPNQYTQQQQMNTGHNAAVGQSVYSAQPYPAQFTQQQMNAMMNPGNTAGFGQSMYPQQHMYPQQSIPSAQQKQPAQQVQDSPTPDVYTGIGLYRDPSQSSEDFLAQSAESAGQSSPTAFQPNSEVFHPSGRRPPGAGSG